MKKYLYILFIVPVILSSCETIPDAHFSVDRLEAYVGEEIYFTNLSYNAVHYEWDFGDGSWTDVVNPVHTYNSTGQFEVILVATSKSGNISQAAKTINILAPTQLEIEVREWELDYIIEDANVRLYGSLYDWDNEQNLIIEGNTNQYGKVLFSGLQQAVYYVDVWEQNHNNWDLRGYENDYWITTGLLLPNQVNQFIAYVDYVGVKGSAERDRSYVVKKLVRKPKEK
jgi:PKD repeat protein